MMYLCKDSKETSVPTYKLKLMIEGWGDLSGLVFRV